MEQYVYYIIAGAIVLLGCIIFYISMKSTNYRSKMSEAPEAIKEYKEVRNKITLSHVEEEVEEEDTSGYSGSGTSILQIIPGIVGLGIALFVGYTVISQVQSTLTDPQYNITTPVSSSMTTVLSIIPILIIIGAVIVGFGVFRGPE